MDWYKTTEELLLATAAGAFCAAVGSLAFVHHFYAIPLHPRDWSLGVRILISAAAALGAAGFAWLAWITRKDSSDKLRRGVQIDRD